MAGLLIKGIPPELHERLKERAKRNHRSLTQEALTILETGMGLRSNWTPPPPVKGRGVLTDEMIDSAKREGRA